MKNFDQVVVNDVVKDFVDSISVYKEDVQEQIASLFYFIVMTTIKENKKKNVSVQKEGGC